MSALGVLRELNAITAAQWGLVTAAQAASRGVSRLQLSRLADAGQLERVGQGVYRATGVPADRYELLKAAWLSINPKLTAQQRLLTPVPDAVASGPAAAFLHGLGDLVPEPYEFTVTQRRQTQRHELRFRIRRLPAVSVTLRDGLPVTTVEQTIADLIESRTDRSLVAGVLADARGLDLARLADLLRPLAPRNGFASGEALLDDLELFARPHDGTPEP
ncbi:MAG TPA: type IV toxin-antitoxin system AbiEi family antitoxin domain-containing protein [Propionicimonas sp.]|nr:type IV toxin-antitoxin system AbiEi family antitoxin domain-containing protein [Propionicimonas sp.]HRA06676.1 type IV toxin-antitoxin system AbiEi family antitoxin domain-containing protein [Propionicimonas sp.]